MNKKLGLILGILITAGAAGTGYYLSTKDAAAPHFREASAKRGRIDVTVLATGTVLPENRLEIKPPIAGRIDNVLAHEGDPVKGGQVLAWMSSTERAALIDAARARGPEEVKKWEGLYRPTPVLAPINGTIILRNVEPGQTFTSNDAIFVMSDRLNVKAQVDETDIARIKLKQKALITLDAYPDQKIFGHVELIAFEAKTVSNVTTYTVSILPDRIPNFMRSGMTASVNFQIDSKDDALLIPSEAVKIEDGVSFVLETSPNPKEKPIRKTIETGLSTPKQTEVTSGLKEGETVLIAQNKPGERKAQPSSPFSPMGGANRSGGSGRGGH